MSSTDKKRGSYDCSLRGARSCAGAARSFRPSATQTATSGSLPMNGSTVLEWSKVLLLAEATYNTSTILTWKKTHHQLQPKSATSPRQSFRSVDPRPAALVNGGDLIRCQLISRIEDDGLERSKKWTHNGSWNTCASIIAVKGSKTRSPNLYDFPLPPCLISSTPFEKENSLWVPCT